MSIKFSSIPQKRLLQGITSASSTFYLNNILSFDGLTDVTSADLGTQHYCAFRNDTGTVLELMEIDPATIGTGPVTILRRGLSFYGDRTTEDADLKLDWPANSIVMLGTDVPQIFQYLKEYIDAAAIAGAVPASTTAAGIVVEASQAEVDARTSTKVVSGTTYKLFTPLDKVRSTKYHDYVADSVGTDAYAITIVPAITSYSAGQEFTFKAGTANTGACSLNVSGLGAKTIKKDVSTDLATGDILANQIVNVVYDGANFQLNSRLATSNIPVVRTYLNAVSPATWTKPAGLKYVVVEVQAGGGGGAGTGSSSSAGGGAGGAGGYAKETIQASSLSATETVTIGTGGAGGSSGDNNGATGGTSSFGSYLSATGGTGGIKAGGSAGALPNRSGGIGGTGTGGDINSVGMAGGNGGTLSGGTGGGNGGSSMFGAGGLGPIQDGSGAAASGQGAGGSGGFTDGSASAVAGGSGSEGIVIVTEFY